MQFLEGHLRNSYDFQKPALFEVEKEGLFSLFYQPAKLFGTVQNEILKSAFNLKYKHLFALCCFVKIFSPLLFPWHVQFLDCRMINLLLTPDRYSPPSIFLSLCNVLILMIIDFLDSLTQLNTAAYHTSLVYQSKLAYCTIFSVQSL